MTQHGSPQPGSFVKLLGTLAALAGFVVIVVSWGTVDRDNAFIGTVIAISGLLLRIEGAISGLHGRNEGGSDVQNANTE
jgi:hypothetical protein